MTSDPPLYESDPAAWEAHLAQGNATQPRKRISADVLLLDGHDRVLLVKPSYKPGWDLPGGMVEANEPPHHGAERELHEELGLSITVGRPLCLDWVAPHGPWDDQLAFIFDGGHLNAAAAETIVLRDGEVAEIEFCTQERAIERLRSPLRRRLTAALSARKSGTMWYLENGTRTTELYTDAATGHDEKRS